MRIKLDQTVGHTCHSSTYIVWGFLVFKETLAFAPLSAIQRASTATPPVLKGKKHLSTTIDINLALPHRAPLIAKPQHGACTLHLICLPGSSLHPPRRR